MDGVASPILKGDNCNMLQFFHCHKNGETRPAVGMNRDRVNPRPKYCQKVCTYDVFIENNVSNLMMTA